MSADLPIRCHCGEIIRVTNWASGPGWVHEHGSSQCRVHARPAERDRERGEQELARYAKAIGVRL